MNLGSILVFLALVAIVVLDIRYLLRNRNSCGGDCGECGGTCKWTEDIKQARADIAREKVS
ncbi:MAG: FeoB-associated Cys-rich membrane protein [Solobacterium sp.]|nr:FeoB-associated Cys-rich membrane protein [Solobacterium sp.]